MELAETRRITASKIKALADLAGLHVHFTENGYLIVNSGWTERFKAPREVVAFLRGFIRGREARK